MRTTMSVDAHLLTQAKAQVATLEVSLRLRNNLASLLWTITLPAGIIARDHSPCRRGTLWQWYDSHTWLMPAVPTWPWGQASRNCPRTFPWLCTRIVTGSQTPCGWWRVRALEACIMIPA